jgi:4-carboxymuconolactone decarboxylase
MRVFAAIAISLCMLASDAHSQTSQDQGAIRIMRSDSQPSRQGPAENFTGSVRVDPLFQASAPARASSSLVPFEPGARTAWHTHPLGPNLDRYCGHGARAALGRPRGRNPERGRGPDSTRSEALAWSRAE